MKLEVQSAVPTCLVIASLAQPGVAIHGLPRRLPTQAPRNDRSGDYSPARGFALIITLALLALLVLAMVALGALVKVGGQVSSAGTQRVQARQNALVGLNVGLGELQRHAGDDTRVTAMAGITGAGLGSTTRNWCGVWRNDGSLVTWLASGAQPAAALLQDAAGSILLVANGSVGATGNNSEHVLAGKIPIVVSETPGAPGVAATVGSYAYLVLDEGGKVPAYAPLPVPVIPPLLHPSFTSQTSLNAALAGNAANLPRVLAYEQLGVLPPTPLAAGVLRGNFHHVTLTSRLVGGPQLKSGLINVNTASIVVLRSLLQTYNAVPGIPAPIGAATIASRGTTMQNGIAAYATAGKASNGPFTSVAAFGSYLSTVFPATGSPTAAQIMNAIGPMLAVRSDTFRIRGYGEALNPADPTRVEATAYCEAVVQRTADPAPNGLGRRFAITYFRWLGPDDI